MDPISLTIVCLTLVSLTAIGAASHSTARTALEVLKSILGTKLPKSK